MRVCGLIYVTSNGLCRFGGEKPKPRKKILPRLDSFYAFRAAPQQKWVGIAILSPNKRIMRQKSTSGINIHSPINACQSWFSWCGSLLETNITWRCHRIDLLLRLFFHLSRGFMKLKDEGISRIRIQLLTSRLLCVCNNFGKQCSVPLQLRLKAEKRKLRSWRLFYSARFTPLSAVFSSLSSPSFPKPASVGK